MKFKFLFLLITSLSGLSSYAQTTRDVHGTVTDSTRQVTLPGSTVKLLTGTDSVTTVTNAKRGRLFSRLIKAKLRSAWLSNLSGTTQSVAGLR